MKKTTIILVIIAILLSATSFVFDAYSKKNSNFSEWGFKKIEGKSPEIAQSTKDLIAKHGGFYIGNEQEPKMFLTFDCGYENGNTPAILDTLKNTATSAAFFVTGHFVDTNPDLIKRMSDEGHIIGNHTINHIVMPNTSDEKNTEEIKGLEEKVKKIIGDDFKMNYLRPPKGEYSEKSLNLTNSLGYKTVFWSSAYVDWTDEHAGDLEYSFNAITNQFHNGAVILLHNTSKNNADVLARVITEAKNKGFSFGKISEI